LKRPATGQYLETEVGDPGPGQRERGQLLQRGEMLQSRVGDHGVVEHERVELREPGEPGQVGVVEECPREVEFGETGEDLQVAESNPVELAAMQPELLKVRQPK